MVNTTYNKKISDRIKKVNEDYGLDIATKNIKIIGGLIFIHTKDVVIFLDTGYHNFSANYAKLIPNRVKTIKKARDKFYCLDDLITLLSNCIRQNKTVFELCEIAAKKKKKKH